MGFEKRTFEDGDITFDIPQWRKNIESIRKSTEKNYLKETQKSSRITEEEVGIKHPKNHSYLRIKDDGSIDAFAENGAGFRFTSDKRLIFFADRIQFIAKQVENITSANGLVSNGYVLNESGIQEFPRKKGKTNSLKELIKKTGLEIG